jgi:glycosyltransferase involved in cell wall biosynthesis
LSGAIIHEWVAKSGGSENVFQAMADAFPHADLHCLWSDDSVRFGGRALNETWLARSPLRRHKALALPFMPFTWRGLSAMGKYEWMLVSSHLFAHHARFRENAEVPKYVYAHTPARYIWNPELDERGGSPLVKTASSLLKKVDSKRAAEPVAIAANSHFIRERISRSWERSADVIYPPVEVSQIQSVSDWASKLKDAEARIMENLADEFILGASRFVPYKGLDRVIEVGQMLRLPVVLAGSGPEESRLRALAAEAGVPVTFISNPSSGMLYSLYQRCSLYVFPPVEDFGIMPVEAMAAGARVLANRVGGASESVVEAECGSLADFSDVADVKRAALIAIGGDRERSIQRAKLFSRERFDREIKSWIPNGSEAMVPSNRIDSE